MTSDLSIEYGHDASYWEGQAFPLWLPPVARMTVTVGKRVSVDTALWRTVELDLCSGPDELYARYPFSVRIFVNDKLSSIVEFERPDEQATATIVLPYGRAAEITVVSELSGIPTALGFSDDRSLAVRFSDLRVIGPAKAPRSHAAPDAQLQDVTYHFAPLVEQLANPIFVIGAYRAGTSVLTWAIGQHPNIFPLDETTFLPLLSSGALAGFELAQTASRNFFDTYRISRDEFTATIGNAIDDFFKRASRRRSFDANLQRLSNKAPDFDPNYQVVRTGQDPKRRWVDGTPENSFATSILRKTFPLAKFIFIVRNPLDVATSMMHFSRAGGNETSAAEGLKMWMRVNRAGLLTARAFGPEVVQLVRYQDLIEHPAQSLRDIFDFLGEPDFPKSAATYSRRINSSAVAPAERTAAIAAMEKEGLGRSELELFEHLSQMALDGWETDEEAARELSEFDNDMVRQLIATWS